jgi:predicted phosphoribosyltransferase
MKPDLPYRNRSEAGRLLSEQLGHYKSKADVVVLGLTRGGVPVAAELASVLQAPLDVVVVRKLGVPFQPELAMGAIAGDGTQVLDWELIHALDLSYRAVDAVTARERLELDRRERLYRGGRPALDLKERTAILVDDGLATGSTMLAETRENSDV